MRKRIFNTYLIGFDEDHFNVKVMYRDIFLIEVIPYTHYCNVYYNSNCCKLYYDAPMLMNNLGKEFIKVSASAIVCADKIIKIDKKLRKVFLGSNLSCIYTRTFWKEIKEVLSIHSYRTGKEKVENIKNYIFAYENDYILQKIQKSAIYFIESVTATHRCNVFSQYGVHEIRGNLSVIEKEFAGNFLKCRRNCIVNMDYVVDIDVKKKCLKLQYGQICTYEINKEKQMIK